MWFKYNYHDYEEAYFHLQYYKCLEIAQELIPGIPDEKLRKKLLKQIKGKKYSWDLPEEEMKELSRILWDIKVWLMVYENWF